MTEPQKHDWPKIIAEITRHMSLYKLATLMDRQLVQAQRWQAGVEPKHSDGDRLLAIHAEYVSHETLQNEPSRSDKTAEARALFARMRGLKPGPRAMQATDTRAQTLTAGNGSGNEARAAPDSQQAEQSAYQVSQPHVREASDESQRTPL